MTVPESGKAAGISRRHVLAGGAAAAGAITHPLCNALAASPALAPAAALLQQTRAFLAMLEPEKRQAASFPWAGKQWRDWNYYGVTGFIKPGLRLEQMTPPQKAAAWAVIGTLLSPAGLEKARNVMTLQDVLAERGDGRGQRSSERFSLSVFGQPAETGHWGFRLEGHHLTFSVAVASNQIVSVTPSSFSVNPNRVTSGRHAGLVTLKAEETIARRLFADLPPKLAERARLSPRALDNILSDAGSERANRKKAGLPVADLVPGQRDLAWELIETFAVEHLVSSLAAAQKKRVRAGDPAAVHFAWYGPNTPETALGYRLIGDSFVIEFASVDPAAQHLHTIYNDLDNVLGRRG